MSMRVSRSLLSLRNRNALIASAACACLSLVLSGCGLGGAGTTTAATSITPIVTAPVAPAPKSVPGQISGYAHGGEQAVSGATVNLFATSNTGVATNGIYVPATPLTPIATGTTGTGSAAGTYSLTVATPCNAPDYMYATITGGNSGGGTNNNLVLLALVGPCTGAATSYVTDIDEVTTVATAYALSSFISVSGSLGSQIVSITADATNYATVSPLSPTHGTSPTSTRPQAPAALPPQPPPSTPAAY